MPERIGAIPTWAWIVGAVLVIGLALTGYRMIQTQQRLQTVQSELESAKQAAGSGKSDDSGPGETERESQLRA
jgi:hypothetical protein